MQIIKKISISQFQTYHALLKDFILFVGRHNIFGSTKSGRGSFQTILMGGGAVFIVRSRCFTYAARSGRSIIVRVKEYVAERE
jgi:hypothetical protein